MESGCTELSVDVETATQYTWNINYNEFLEF